MRRSILAAALALLALPLTAANTPSDLVRRFYTAFPGGRVYGDAEEWKTQSPLLERYLSKRLYKLLLDAVAYDRAWSRRHPDQPSPNGGPPVIYKPPFGDGFDFAGSADGPRGFAVKPALRAPNGTWRVPVHFWYDRSYTWDDVVEVIHEDGRYVIDDVVFSDQHRVSEGLKWREAK